MEMPELAVQIRIDADLVYKVIEREYYIDDLIQEAIDDGWLPIGGLCVYVVPDPRNYDTLTPHFCQALVKDITINKIQQSPYADLICPKCQIDDIELTYKAKDTSMFNIRVEKSFMNVHCRTCQYSWKVNPLDGT